jgi:hypothetical protein
VTTRTHGGGKGRPCHNTRKKLFNEPITSDSDGELEEDSSSEQWMGDEFGDGFDEGEFNEELLLAEDDLLEEMGSIKPDANRVIIEVDPFLETLEKHCRCPDCNGPMNAEVKRLCLASTFVLTCANKTCTYVHVNWPSGAIVRSSPDARSRERSTDSAINILYVLGFLSVGDGCTEAARLLGLLGLPNDTTMESRSFTYIEERISLFIHNLTDEILHENLSEEIKRSVTDPILFEHWTKAQVPLITCIRR